MRGGAIPILAWGTILLVIIYGFGVAVWLARREALRRGPPEPRDEPETVPQASVGAVLIGLAAGCALFGLAWARFLLDFGIALFVFAVGRLVLENRAQRASRRKWLGKGEHA